MPIFIMLMVEAAIIPFVEKQIMVQKQHAIRQVIEIAYGIVEDSAKLIHESHISLTEAQERARHALKEIRYSNNNYFWINDTGKPIPRMIMHPTEPNLDGKLLDDPKFNIAKSTYHGLNGAEKNLDNLNLFVACNEVAEKSNHGYITYFWSKPTTDGGVTGELYQKLSYVKLFKPWGWVIGSGIYVDDVHEEAANLRHWVYGITLLFTFILLILSYLLNIAKRKQLEQTLSETIGLLTLLMRSSPIYIFIKDVTSTRSRILQASENFKQMIGISGSDMVGKTMEELFAPEVAAKMTAEDWSVISSGEVLELEESINGRNYTTIKFPIFQSDKTLLAGYTIDITERKEREKELQQKNAELERFAYTVSHDLKSPLITIKGFAGALERDLLKGNYERMEGDLRRVNDAADKMNDLMRDLLELSTIGHVVSAPEPVDMNLLVVDVLAQLAGPLSNKNINVTVQPGLPAALCDRQRMAEVVQNLIENAVNYIGEQKKPQILFGMRTEDGINIFFVQDNGIGIDKKYHQNIFGLFNQLDAKSNGTGIGLALVKRIVELHGGNVWVESDGAGKGSRFCFTVKSEE